ncbi:hypothetical protein N3K66_001784 [Trichothecium roseum]|uniref:Uncharacterized protein n=1 Tax=Trichothecium roseum TaxID=47278 RepID=A0ACC0V7Q6_9HYPO|nr:hypothetical protein N3K66_001784 [Trichothecium roseum]
MLKFKAIVGIIVGFAGAVHAVQESDTTYAFEYHGCAKVDLTCFSDPVDLPDGQLCPDTCRAACQGHKVTALFPDACRCGDDASAFDPLEPDKCDYPCMGDPKLGICGSKCPETGSNVSTIFVTFDVNYPGDGTNEPIDPDNQGNEVTPMAPVPEPVDPISDVKTSTTILEPSDTMTDSGISDTIIASTATTPSSSASETPPRQSSPRASDPSPTTPGESVEHTGDPPIPSEIPASTAIATYETGLHILTGFVLFMMVLL